MTTCHPEKERSDDGFQRSDKAVLEEIRVNKKFGDGKLAILLPDVSY